MPTLSRLLLAAVVALVALPTAAGAQPKGKTEITWYGHATFTVRTPAGTVIAIDPWFGNPKAPPGTADKLAEVLPKVDFILVTHGHFDHTGEAVAIGKRTGAKLITNFELANALVGAGYPKDQAGFDSIGNMGGAIEAGDATVIMVPALHSSGFGGDKGTEVGGNPVGFVVKVKGGPTLYHTGDTDAYSDMRLIPERYGKVDVMLACVGGRFTMDGKGAALAASWVKPKVLVPMHYGTFPVLPGTPEQLAAAAKGTKIQVMEPGKPVAF